MIVGGEKTCPRDFSQREEGQKKKKKKKKGKRVDLDCNTEESRKKKKNGESSWFRLEYAIYFLRCGDGGKERYGLDEKTWAECIIHRFISETEPNQEETNKIEGYEYVQAIRRK